MLHFARSRELVDELVRRIILYRIEKYVHYGRYFQINDLKITWPVSRTVLTSKNYRQSKPGTKASSDQRTVQSARLDCSRIDSAISAYLTVFVYLVHSSIYAIVYFVPDKTTMSKRRSSFIFHARAIQYLNVPLFRFPVCFVPWKTNITSFVVYYITNDK